MAKVALYNMEGTKTGDMEVSDAIFAAEVNKSVLHQVVVNYLANQRQGTQSTKTRTEVRGGGIKPWRQKGTGRARQGSIRAPQWTGGGVALGPKPRSYRFSVNKKIKRIALKSALSAKYADYKIFVIDELAVDEIKTAKIVALLKGLDVNSKALIVTADADEKRRADGGYSRPASELHRRPQRKARQECALSWFYRRRCAPADRCANRAPDSA